MDWKKSGLGKFEKERKLFGNFSKTGPKSEVKARDRALEGTHVSFGKMSAGEVTSEGPGGS